MIYYDPKSVSVSVYVAVMSCLRWKINAFPCYKLHEKSLAETNKRLINTTETFKEEQREVSPNKQRKQCKRRRANRF